MMKYVAPVSRAMLASRRAWSWPMPKRIKRDQHLVLDDRVDRHAGVARVVDEVIELEVAALIDAVGEHDQRVAAGLFLQLVQHLDDAVVEVRLADRLHAIDRCRGGVEVVREPRQPERPSG